MIRVNYDEIVDLDMALKIIEKLVDSMNNCYCAEFCLCPHCGAICTKGYICPNCSKDPTEIKNGEVYND